MIFRRNESFRYTFNNPLQCQFKIIKIDELLINSEFGSGQIIDISPNGMKLMAPLNIWTAHKKIGIETHFFIEDHFLQIPGILRWQQKEFQNGHYFYGVQFEHTRELSERIIDLIKLHARKTTLTQSEKTVAQQKENRQKDGFLFKSKSR